MLVASRWKNTMCLGQYTLTWEKSILCHVIIMLVFQRYQQITMVLPMHRHLRNLKQDNITIWKWDLCLLLQQKKTHKTENGEHIDYNNMCGNKALLVILLLLQIEIDGRTCTLFTTRPLRVKTEFKKQKKNKKNTHIQRVAANKH